MKEDRNTKHVDAVVKALVTTGARTATKYISPTEIVRATRRRYRGRIVKGARTVDIVLTIGRPNYAERAFIKKARMGREPFPVKKIQLKYPSANRR